MRGVRSRRRAGWVVRQDGGHDRAAHSSSPELVHYAVSDAVATITLDCPANRNALSRQLVTELFAHLERAGADDERAGGAGRELRPGLLLRRRPVRGDDGGHGGGRPPDRRPAAADRHPRQAGRHQNLGAVRAGGIGIVAAADIAISAEDATFALTEVKLGLAAAIISLTVHHRMNPRAAALTTLGGEVFSGADAAAYGLVTRAVPADRPRRRGGGGLRQPGHRCRPGAARVEADPQPRPGRPHRRPRRRRWPRTSARLFASDEAREAMTAFLAEEVAPRMHPTGGSGRREAP